MDLEGKKVIVTGGVKGFGRSLVNKLISEGSIVGVFDIDKEGLNKLKESNEKIFCKLCDVTDYRQVGLSINEFYTKYNNIDVLVNNVGYIYSSPLVSFDAQGIKKHDIEMWRKVISTNLDSVFYMTLDVVEKMVLNRTKGIIVNVSSISALGNPGQCAYSAAKAGINSFTTALSKELGLMGIRIVCIAPGFADTESTREALSEDVLKNWIKKIPLRRLAKADEIADGIISIIENDYFNGKVFELDGGLTI